MIQLVYDQAPEGTQYVINRYRNPAANLRTQLVRYITAAGLTPWPKPWQNMRASRATELADEFPSHVCAAWLGHTEAVADEFYRQVTDEHFKKAVRFPVRAVTTDAAKGPHGENDLPAETAVNAQERQCTLSAAISDTYEVGPGRFELPTSPLSAVRSDQLSYEPFTGQLSRVDEVRPTRRSRQARSSRFGAR